MVETVSDNPSYWNQVYEQFHKGNPSRMSVWNEEPTPFFTRLIDFLKYSGVKTILDAGCGDGRNIKQFLYFLTLIILQIRLNFYFWNIKIMSIKKSWLKNFLTKARNLLFTSPATILTFAVGDMWKIPVKKLLPTLSSSHVLRALIGVEMKRIKC